MKKILDFVKEESMLSILLLLTFVASVTGFLFPEGSLAYSIGGWICVGILIILLPVSLMYRGYKIKKKASQKLETLKKEKKNQSLIMSLEGELLEGNLMTVAPLFYWFILLYQSLY